MRVWQWPRALTARWRRWWNRPLSLEDRNIRYFTADTAVQGVIQGGIVAFISVFVVRLGASNLLVSLLTSLPALLGAILSIPAGLYVARQPDPIRLTNQWRLVHRSTFLLVALLPFFVKRYLAEAVVIAWTLEAVPAAVINLSWTAVVAEIVPPRRRPTVNGIRWALLSLVIAISVAVFGPMLDRVTFPLGYQIAFAISFLGGIISIYFFSLLKMPPALAAPSPAVPAQKTAGVQQEQAPARKAPFATRVRRYVRSVFEEPQFLRYLATTFVLRVGLNMPAALYSIYWVRHLNASDSWIGWQATARSLALIVGYFLWGRVASRKGHHLVLLACALGAGLYPALLPLAPGQVWLPVIAVVYGFFVTGIDLCFFDTLLHICPVEKRSGLIAVNTVLANAAISLAPMLGSLLSDWLGLRMVFWLAGGLHLLAAALFALFRIAADQES